MNSNIEIPIQLEGKLDLPINMVGEIDYFKEGIDTRDATATSNDIVINKTAYARGEKLTGTYEGIIPTGTLTITENGEKDVYNYANVNVDIDTGSNIDWTEIGYAEQPDSIQDGFDYAKEIQENWDASITDRAGSFQYDGRLVFFPSVDTSNITNASGMFRYAAVLNLADDFDFSSMTDCSSMFGESGIKYVNNVVLENATVTGMFSNVNNLKINNFVASSNSNSTSFNKSNNLTINTLGIRSATRTIFSACNNLDIKQIINYDNHTARNRALLGTVTMTNRTVDEFLKYFKTLIYQSGSYKTLKSMGFTQDNCAQAVLSDEWQGLVNAGWTTGY